MAMAMVRSGLLRTALRGGSRPSAPVKRNFSSSARHDDARESSLSLSLSILIHPFAFEFISELWSISGVLIFWVLALGTILRIKGEAEKWEKITYVGIATCTVLAIYNLSKGHPHYEEPPPYPYLHIRNKEFPWGPDGLFEKKHHH
ncbi:hypothetical protein F2P56_023972 [Juglans regia]|uniref:Cytochrome c oxidase subunit 6a, mitochondrial-like isoform X1 n=2 Tax=Juglans regia TaxID=51240 RepID=A0A2I4FWB2_JUGRE|nr:cytochrome c oxidase subunit 6a, mitochondrial-like isoform X1 [Juglans regia]KAF5454296.1 hypothetical protein F2P56_023972 [Juglans regia]